MNKQTQDCFYFIYKSEIWRKLKGTEKLHYETDEKVLLLSPFNKIFTENEEDKLFGQFSRVILFAKAPILFNLGQTNSCFSVSY